MSIMSNKRDFYKNIIIDDDGYLIVKLHLNNDNPSSYDRVNKYDYFKNVNVVNGFNMAIKIPNEDD